MEAHVWSLLQRGVGRPMAMAAPNEKKGNPAPSIFHFVAFARLFHATLKAPHHGPPLTSIFITVKSVTGGS